MVLLKGGEYHMVFEGLTGSLSKKEDGLVRASITGLRGRITQREGTGRLNASDASAYRNALDVIEKQKRIKKDDRQKLHEIEEAIGRDSTDSQFFKSVEIEGKEKKNKEQKKDTSKKGSGCLKSMLKGTYKYGLPTVAHGTIPTTLAAFWATNPNLMPGEEWNAIVIFIGALVIQEGGIRLLLKKCGLNPKKRKK